MWIHLARSLLAGGLLFATAAVAQESSAPKPEHQQTEPQYDDTFSGPILEVSADKVVVSRSILGQPAEKRTFLIKPDTRIEGNLKVKVRVTVGFVTSDEGDVAKLIVVRQQQKK